MKAILFLVLLLGLCACERAMQNMYDQPKYKTMGKSELFADGASARTPPAGSVPQSTGAFAGTSSGRLGEENLRREAEAADAQAIPYPVTQQLLARGRERYGIYCMPCHSPVGDGDGWITRRGFPHPPSYHIDRLRQAPDRHLFDVITNGYGIMYPYADRVDPSDRWAIVAYIRTLQLSQNAVVSTLPADMQSQLAARRGGQR
ncbi:cbb3-type cytochrome c oxidase subunit III [Paucimonas lemoignei]|uniref:Cbb3-type cytochrome c oxidase subunit III n=1 Tax=Paucimonas lemoignei TaxID=29443 RepID=A0A4R3I3T3_PAULE|nr:cytochrome c [Paucimonas lemoignei]TCS39365.1 cbb3-type cytochrome c oxidase subunit III [Paucimonas lemoignei]